ncbi:MAG: hypothetical protein WBO73_05220 [Gammaproteobacteria bacterium]|jgi:hypothetical protein
MIKRKDYVESLRTELKSIRKKLHDSSHSDTICSIDKIHKQSNMLKHYEGMEYVVREVVKNLEMGRGPDEIQETLMLNEARFRKIIRSNASQPFNWRYYAKGGLAGVDIVRALML